MIINPDNLILLAIKASIEAGKEILEIYSSSNFEVEYKKDNSPLTKADKKSHKIISKILKESKIDILSEEGNQLSFEKRKNWEYLWLVDPLDGTKEFMKQNGEFTINIALIKNNTPIIGVIFIPVSNTLYFSTPSLLSYKISNAINLINNSSKLPDILKYGERINSSENITDNKLTVVVSKSHLSEETTDYINQLKKKGYKIKYLNKGSALKFCSLAEGSADIYPRFGPTMEWDTAAGHAIAINSGCTITQIDEKTPLTYNKPDLKSPWFIVKSKKTTNII